MYNIYVYILSINALYSVVSPGDQRNLVTISHFTFKITLFLRSIEAAELHNKWRDMFS